MLINEATKGGSVMIEIAVAALIILAVGSGVYAVQHSTSHPRTASAVSAQQ